MAEPETGRDSAWSEEDSLTFRDLGRYEVTGRPAERWHYRTPSLRNVALTAPYGQRAVEEKKSSTEPAPSEPDALSNNPFTKIFQRPVK